jgi:hypothetical protein
MHPAGTQLFLTGGSSISLFTLTVGTPAPATSDFEPANDTDNITATSASGHEQLTIKLLGRLVVPEHADICQLRVNAIGARLLAVMQNATACVWDLHSNVLRHYFSEDLDPVTVRTLRLACLSDHAQRLPLTLLAVTSSMCRSLV